MPLHRIFVPTGLYTPEDKAALAQAITDVYAGLPPFYVVVLFIDLEPSSFFVGGKTTERMVRISVEHIARNFKECVRQFFSSVLLYRGSDPPKVMP
jgi:phenylpyruvate tautomerase PptA (4-oxalocrotonate tautomerase family)